MDEIIVDFIEGSTLRGCGAKDTIHQQRKSMLKNAPCYQQICPKCGSKMKGEANSP